MIKGSVKSVVVGRLGSRLDIFLGATGDGDEILENDVSSSGHRSAIVSTRRRAVFIGP